MECVVHYKNKNSYSNLKLISQINEEIIREAKIKRQEPGGANGHEEQCCGIPDVINPELHGLHLKPCYKRYY